MEYIKIENIRENPSNPRTITKEKFTKLVKSIKEFPKMLEIRPLVVDKDGFVLGGNMRLKALIELGYKEVPIVRVENLTEEEQKRFIITDNLSFGEWDWDRLANEWDQTQLEEWGLLEAPILPDEKDDAIPENAPTISVLGDLYELGNHRVLCGDSTKIEDVARLSDGRVFPHIDMFLTDPPYNVDYTGKTSDALKLENDKMSKEDFRQFLKDAFSTADSFMKGGAVFYIWHADSEGFNVRGACHDIGWVVRQCLIWNKNVLVMGRQDYHWKHEPCLYGWKEGTHLWNSDRTQTTVLNFDRPTKSKSHPTMKPVELIVYQVTNNTKESDVVLDSFLGSGSTLIACEKTGRICKGLELDPHYVDVIVQRWVDYTGIETIKKNGEVIEWKKSTPAL